MSRFVSLSYFAPGYPNGKKIKMSVKSSLEATQMICLKVTSTTKLIFVIKQQPLMCN